MQESPRGASPAQLALAAPQPLPSVSSAPIVRRTPRRQRYGLGRLLRANIFDILRLAGNSYQALIGFLALVGLNSYYLLAMRPQGFERICAAPGFGACFIPALYETLKLLIFQSTLALPDDGLGRLLFFALPILGLGLIIQSVSAFGRQAFNKAGRIEAWQVSLASTFRDHIIVCGLGRIGWRVVSLLADNGSKVVVIERNWTSEFVQRALKLGVPVIHGDACDHDVLLRAGVKRARVVIADIDDDLLDIEIALAARRLNGAIRVIVRSFYEDLDRTLNSEGNLGPNSAFSASALGAPTFAAATLSRDVIGAIPLGNELYVVCEAPVLQGSQLQGTIQEIEDRYHVRVIRRTDPGGKPLAYHKEQSVAVGERLKLIGRLSSLERARMAALADLPQEAQRHIPQQHPAGAHNTIIICGLGKIGYRVINMLLQFEPPPRIVVVHTNDRRPVFADRLHQIDGITLVPGDMRDERVLQRADLEHAYAVAALTSDDTINLETGLAARRLLPHGQIIVRVFSDSLAENLSTMFGINTTYSNSNLTSATLTAAALVKGVSYGIEIDATLFGMMELAIAPGDRLLGVSIEHLRAEHEAHALLLTRGPDAYPLPTPEVVLASGDTLTVLAPIKKLARLRA